MNEQPICHHDFGEVISIPQNMSFEDVCEGSVFGFSRIISQDDVDAFSHLTGDKNPLHVDKHFGRSSPYGQNIIYGMLASAFFSTIVGMYCPGKKALYLSQSLNFKLPIFPGDRIIVRGTVISKNNSIKMVSIKTEIIKDGKVAINGEAKARFMEE